jgi:alanyl aminopeptidase
MANSIDPEVASAVRDRILSPELKDNEIPNIFWGQMSKAENREAMWVWTKANMAEVLERIPNWKKGQLPSYFESFCSREQATDVESAFAPIIDTLESGPRYLANALETIQLCAAFVDKHQITSGA